MNSQTIFKTAVILLLFTSVGVAKRPKTQFFKTKSVRQNLAQTRKNIVKLNKQLKSSRKSFAKKPTKQKKFKARRRRVTKRRSFLQPKGTFRPNLGIRRRTR